MFQTLNKKSLGYDLFIQKIKGKVQEVMGEEYEVIIQKIVKNNSLQLDSLIVLKKGRNIAPNIYLEAYYESYLQGSELEDIVDRLCLIYNHCAIPTIRNDFGYKLEDVKKYIVYRIVNYQKNFTLLQELPHKKFMDFAITYHCLVKNDDELIGTLKITNDHTKLWGITSEELYNLANENTERLFPAVIRDMDDIIRSFLSEDEDIPEEIIEDLCKHNYQQEVKMYVLSNANSVNGASCLLYENVIRNFAEKIKSDLIIIPSSIHEVILLPFYKDMKEEELNDMVKDVNASQVPIDEILSEHIYYYFREADRITM